MSIDLLVGLSRLVHPGRGSRLEKEEEDEEGLRALGRTVSLSIYLFPASGTASWILLNCFLAQMAFPASETASCICDDGILVKIRSCGIICHKLQIEVAYPSVVSSSLVQQPSW
jgi:hypothetical protein